MSASHLIAAAIWCATYVLFGAIVAKHDRDRNDNLLEGYMIFGVLLLPIGFAMAVT